MWARIPDYGKLTWCLEHGASFATPGEQPHKRPMLQAVAESGDIANFGFLRSTKAALGPCTLQRAVMVAASGNDDSNDAEKDDKN